MGLLDRLATNRTDAVGRPDRFGGAPDDQVFATKALGKFLATLRSRESPVLLDLGPVVGSNVSLFGERLGCKIFVEDLFADLDRHLRDARPGGFAEFVERRFSQPPGTVAGILCWDLFDYLDKASARALALQLSRVLGAGGALLAFFGTALPRGARYTKFVILDEGRLEYRRYPAARGRQAVLQNRDIIRLFPELQVSDSFLLQNSLREILFRKPA